MLLSVTHKSTTCKDGDGTYIYIVTDIYGPREIKFTMPISLAILGESLSTIALQQAYTKQGRTVLAQVLDEHYAILTREGYRNARQRDIEFYRRVFG